MDRATGRVASGGLASWCGPPALLWSGSARRARPLFSCRPGVRAVAFRPAEPLRPPRLAPLRCRIFLTEGKRPTGPAARGRCQQGPFEVAARLRATGCPQRRRTFRGRCVGPHQWRTRSNSVARFGTALRQPGSLRHRGWSEAGAALYAGRRSGLAAETGLRVQRESRGVLETRTRDALQAIAARAAHGRDSEQGTRPACTLWCPMHGTGGLSEALSCITHGGTGLWARAAFRFGWREGTTARRAGCRTRRRYNCDKYHIACIIAAGLAAGSGAVVGSRVRCDGARGAAPR